MERPLSTEMAKASRITTTTTDPDLATLARIDSAAFEGFWRIGVEGIKEAIGATPTAVVILAEREGVPVGYAVAGAEMTNSYLQRIAVMPDHEGEGFGSSLLSHAVLWARQKGSRSMVLNLRPGNSRARALYSRNGFVATPTKLRVLRFEI
jgi:ribosomal-protein-alanine N-acetyltransferase